MLKIGDCLCTSSTTPHRHDPRPKITDGPAPGDYNPAGLKLGSTGPAYSMGTGSSSRTAVEARFKELFPGPGEYHRAAAVPGGPAYSMGSRPAAAGSKGGVGSGAEDLPGPGEYYRYGGDLTSYSWLGE